MVKQIVLLSGSIGSGKTTLCRNLETRFCSISIKTKDLIKELAAHVKPERQALQRYGESLDRRTQGGCVRDALARRLTQLPDESIVVVDAVRIEPQINAIRKAYGPRVFHIHLHAPDAVLESRYNQRHNDIQELPNYSAAKKNKTERKVGRLGDIADIVIDTERCTEHDVLVRAASHLGLYGREYLRLVDVFIGGQYGSEGKGHIVSYLAREYDLLVRVGGPNAGHKVYEEPEPYTFHQLPSGSRTCDAHLVIGPGAVLYVPTLLQEIGDCGIDAARLSIDPQAMIISDEDREHEKQLVQDIGSTGQGVGAATARRIMQRLTNPAELARDIPDLKPFIKDTREVLEEAFYSRKRVMIEGTRERG